MNPSMLKLLDLAEDALSAGDKCVLCSIVRLEGSGYGRVGARLLITETGEREGYISGGCLERDLCHRALHEVTDRAKLMTFDTRGQTTTPTRYTAGCEGIVYVLCQPLLDRDCFPWKVLNQVKQQRQAVRQLTVYRSELEGFSAGDSLAHFVNTSEQIASSRADSPVGTLANLLINTPGSFTASISDSAQRRLDFVVEQIDPPQRLVVFGAGDDARPVVAMAIGLGWEVCVVGKNPQLVNKSRFPGAQLRCGQLAELALQLDLDEFTHAVSMTHDFSSDLDLLPILIDSPLQSIGLLGSKRRLAKLLTELHHRGRTLSPEAVDRIRSPMGLDIGAESPEEIALSIVSELLAIERAKPGARLSARSTSIHAQLSHYSFEYADVDAMHELVPQLFSTEDRQLSDAVALKY